MNLLLNKLTQVISRAFQEFNCRNLVLDFIFVILEIIAYRLNYLQKLAHYYKRIDCSISKTMASLFLHGVQISKASFYRILARYSMTYSHVYSILGYALYCALPYLRYLLCLFQRLISL